MVSAISIVVVISLIWWTVMKIGMRVLKQMTK